MFSRYRLDYSGGYANKFSTNGEILEFSALFFILISFFSSILIWYFRSNIGSIQHWQILYFFLAAATPAAVIGMHARFAGRIDGLYGPLLALGTLATFALPALLPALVVPIIAIAVSINVALAVSLTRLNRVLFIGASLAPAFVFVLFHFVVMNSSGYATLFTPEAWLSGTLHPDTAYHSAISAMITFYGEISTGIDGLSGLRYHILTHTFLGMMAKSAALPITYGYFLGMQIIAVPLLYFFLCLSVIVLAGPLGRKSLVWIVIALPICMAIIVQRWGWESHLLSESHIFGLMLLLLGLSTLKSIADDEDAPPSNAHLAAGLLIGILALTAKISIGLVWFTGLGYLLLRKGPINVRLVAVFAVWAILIAAVTVAIALPADHVSTARFNPFHSLQYTGVWITNLGMIGLALIVIALQWMSASQHARYLLEALAIMMIAAVTPAMLLELDGFFYFMNVGTWVAISVVCAFTLRAATRWRWAGLGVGAATVLAAGLLVVDIAPGFGQRFVAARNSYLAALAPDEATRHAETGFFDRAPLKAMATAYTTSSGGRMLSEVSRNGLSAGDDVLIFVPPDAEWFWSSHPSCIVPPISVPGSVGLPMLLGVPPVSGGCELSHYYGYSSYGPQSRSVFADDITLCERAADRGFGAVLVFNAAAASRLLQCNSAD